MLREYQVRYRATHTAEEIEPDKCPSSPLVLQPGAKHPEREHVECEMRKPRVHEHVRDCRPPVSRKAGWVEGERRIHRILSKQRQLQEIHADVQRQQPLNSARHAWRLRCFVQLAHADLRLRDYILRPNGWRRVPRAEPTQERALQSARRAPG